jgi:hypothetical protein
VPVSLSHSLRRTQDNSGGAQPFRPVDTHHSPLRNAVGATKPVQNSKLRFSMITAVNDRLNRASRDRRNEAI